MITFTALSGAARSSHSTPLCYLLQVDDVRILLDCGSPDWCPENVDEENYPWEEYCQTLREYAPTVDLVLLSHGDLAHAGLYPYAYSRWNLKAPAYSTLPVQAMARIATAEDVDTLREEEDFEQDLPTSSDTNGMDEDRPNPAPAALKQKGKYIATSREVHDSFDSLNTLRYSQPAHLQGKCQGLTITPFNAGHTLGGTIWKIRSPSSGTIIYAVNINHMKERHLDGTVLMRQSSVFEPLARPDLLITDAERANVITSRRRDRDEALIDTVTATLTSRSSLLLPCDSSTRLLELLVLLDQQWNHHKLRYPICLMSRTAGEMLTFVRSMMEWLGGTINREDVGEDGGNGPRDRDRKRRRAMDEDGEEDALGAFALRFRHVEFFSSPQALIQKYSSKDPKLILAVPINMSHGSSRSLFADFATVQNNVVLLTHRGDEGTLGRLLFDKWNNKQRQETKWENGKIGNSVMMDEALTVTIKSKVPLQGAELEEYLQKQREERDKEAAHQAALTRNQRMLEADEDDESDSDSDSDAEEDEVRDGLMDVDDEDRELKRQRKAEKAAEGDWAATDDDGLPKQLISFDIYLKGNVSKANTFFKSSGSTTHRFRMFPYVEKRRRVDEYGETIDVGLWLRKGKVFEEEAESDEVKINRKKHEEVEAKKAALEVPSKFVVNHVEVTIACRLLFIDMEGLNDGRAVKTIVPKVSPRKMIIVHASQEGTDTLVESCSNIRAMTKDIYAPPTGETVQIGQQTNSFSISISEALLAATKMSRFEDNEVGYVTGRITTHATSTIATLEPAAVQTKRVEENPTVLGPRAPGTRPPATLPHSTMIGELKLTALKARLASIGIQAELVGEGVLICGAAARLGGDKGDGSSESVAVRKTARGRVELEGNVSKVYYMVRKEIYNLHALVAT